MEKYTLKASGDKRDRTKEIEALLETEGICILDKGNFYVSGVTMPPDSTLKGLGENSVLVLAEEVSDDCTVKMNSRCRIQDLTLRGDDSTLPEAVGTRHGIGYLGDSEPDNRGEQYCYGILNCLHIHSFSGGGILCKGTGYSIDSSLSVTNCRIHHCGVGIHIPHFSEYHKFTNVLCTRNLYGCINNGGNNVFTACSFDANTTGFLMDNSDGKACNNSHGSVIGCTFNHSGSNHGIGIHILNNKYGYVFTGCQMFYSKIHIENSNGIQFANFNCGEKEKIAVKGGGLVLFSACMFTSPPLVAVEDNDNVYFRDCFTRKGAAIDNSVINAPINSQ